MERLLSARLRTLLAKLREAEGEAGFDRMQQIARDAYASTESNLYAISPETSHVPKEIVDGDPDFWLPKPSPHAITSPAVGTGKKSPRKALETDSRE
jgi:hypothetical protein